MLGYWGAAPDSVTNKLTWAGKLFLKGSDSDCLFSVSVATNPTLAGQKQPWVVH